MAHFCYIINAKNLQIMGENKVLGVAKMMQKLAILSLDYCPKIGALQTAVGCSRSP